MTPIKKAEKICKELSDLWLEAARDESLITLNLYSAIESLKQFIKENK